METNSPNIEANIEHNEDVEQMVEEPEPFPEKSILKARKPRSKAHIDAFSKCQARRREIIQNKKTGKTTDIKNMPVEIQ